MSQKRIFSWDAHLDSKYMSQKRIWDAHLESKYVSHKRIRFCKQSVYAKSPLPEVFIFQALYHIDPTSKINYLFLGHFWFWTSIFGTGFLQNRTLVLSNFYQLVFVWVNYIQHYFWPFRHFIRVMKKHDLTNKKTMTKTKKKTMTRTLANTVRENLQRAIFETFDHWDI